MLQCSITNQQLCPRCKKNSVLITSVSVFGLALFYNKEQDVFYVPQNLPLR